MEDTDSSVHSAFPGTKNTTRMIICLQSRKERSEKIAPLFPLRKLPHLHYVRLRHECLPPKMVARTNKSSNACLWNYKGQDPRISQWDAFSRLEKYSKMLRRLGFTAVVEAGMLTTASCPQWGLGNGSTATVLDASSQEGLHGDSNQKRYRAPSTLEHTTLTIQTNVYFDFLH